MPGQATAYYADGTPVAPAELPAALDAGTAGYYADDSVSLVSPYGVTETVPGSEVADRLGKGYQVEGAARVARREEGLQYGTAGQAALALGEGALSGATLGVSDLVAAGVDPEYAREAAKRAEYQGTASMAGQVVGGLAPALLTGGTSLGIEGGVAATTTAGRIGLAA